MDGEKVELQNVVSHYQATILYQSTPSLVKTQQEEALIQDTCQESATIHAPLFSYHQDCSQVDLRGEHHPIPNLASHPRWIQVLQDEGECQGHNR